MSKSKIEYCHYTWNPVIGCSRGCPYCYAKRFNDRFHLVKDFSKPTFFPERMNALSGIKKPSIIFVGSMCDLWNDDIPQEWKYEVLKECWKHPQHIFLFLTKNLRGYELFRFPNNCWIGFSYDGTRNYKDYAEAWMRETVNGKNYIWVSIEPLQRNFDKNILSMVWDWVVVGGMTPKNCHDEQTVKSIIKTCTGPLFLKPNLHSPCSIEKFPPELTKILTINPLKK